MDLPQGLALALSLVGAWPVFKGGFLGLSLWSRAKRLRGLRQERDFLVALKTSESKLCVYLLGSLLVVTLALGVTMMTRWLAFYPETEKYVLVVDWLVGFFVYMYSAHKLGTLQRLKKFENSIERLNRQIAKLEGVQTDVKS